MVEIRRLTPVTKIAMPRPPAGQRTRRRMFKRVERRRGEFPPPTPQPTPCVLWQGITDDHGYGTRWVADGLGQYVKVRIHRWVMGEVVGRPLEPKEFVMHACDQPLCFRVDHLSLGTARDNNLDMYEKGRFVHVANKTFGDRNPNTKVVEAEKRKIINAYRRGTTARSLAEHYGVNVSTISRIVRGQSYRHLRSSVPKNRPPSAWGGC